MRRWGKKQGTKRETEEKGKSREQTGKERKKIKDDDNVRCKLIHKRETRNQGNTK